MNSERSALHVNFFNCKLCKLHVSARLSDNDLGQSILCAMQVFTGKTHQVRNVCDSRWSHHGHPVCQNWRNHKVSICNQFTKQLTFDTLPSVRGRTSLMLLSKFGMFNIWRERGSADMLIRASVEKQVEPTTPYSREPAANPASYSVEVASTCRDHFFD